MTASTAQTPDSAGVNLFPPVIFFVCFIVGTVLEIVHGSDIPLVPRPARVVSGIVLAAAAFGLMMWGHGRFRALGVNVKTNLPASRLVTNGAFRFSRNPMYVGFVGILAGLGWAAGSLPMMLSAIPMFLYLHSHVIRREEKYLTRTFGDDYKQYCARVRRWL